jgi:hypothetical protein
MERSHDDKKKMRREQATRHPPKPSFYLHPSLSSFKLYTTISPSEVANVLSSTSSNSLDGRKKPQTINFAT